MTICLCGQGDELLLKKRLDGRSQPVGWHVESLCQALLGKRSLVLETEQEPAGERIESHTGAGGETTVNKEQAITARQHVEGPLDLLLRRACRWHGEGLSYIGRLGRCAKSYFRQQPGQYECHSHNGHRDQEDGRKRLRVGKHHLSTYGCRQMLDRRNTLRSAEIETGRQ